jgi:hypothetical protein
MVLSSPLANQMHLPQMGSIGRAETSRLPAGGQQEYFTTYARWANSDNNDLHVHPAVANITAVFDPRLLQQDCTTRALPRLRCSRSRQLRKTNMNFFQNIFRPDGTIPISGGRWRW